jgi:hypothetical protein
MEEIEAPHRSFCKELCPISSCGSIFPMKLWIPIILLLSSCVGGSLGNHADIEEYPLREATEQEGNRLKRCLLAAHSAYERHRERTGNPARRTSELRVDADCQGFFLGQKRTPEGYEIMAQFHQGFTTVRWSVNQDGVVEEHLEVEFDDGMDFF